MHDWYSVYCSPPFVLDRDVSVDSQFIPNSHWSPIQPHVFVSQKRADVVEGSVCSSFDQLAVVDGDALFSVVDSHEEPVVASAGGEEHKVEVDDVVCAQPTICHTCIAFRP